MDSDSDALGSVHTGSGSSVIGSSILNNSDHDSDFSLDALSRDGEDDEDEEDEEDDEDDERATHRHKRVWPEDVLFDDDHEIVANGHTSPVEEFIGRRYDSMLTFLRHARRACDEEIVQLVGEYVLRKAVEEKDVDARAWPCGFDELILAGVALQLTAKYIRKPTPLSNPAVLWQFATILDDVARTFAVAVLLDTTQIIAKKETDTILEHLVQARGEGTVEKSKHMRVEGPGVYTAVFEDGTRVQLPTGTPQLHGLGPFLFFFWNMFENIGTYIKNHNEKFDATASLATYTYKIGPRVVMFIDLLYKRHMNCLCY